MDALKNFILLVAVSVLVVMCSGCATRPVVVATDEPIVSGQVSAERLKTANDFAGELLRFATEEIGLIRRAADAGSAGIDTALELLDQYDALFQKCISRIRKLESLTRTGEGEGQCQE